MYENKEKKKRQNIKEILKRLNNENEDTNFEEEIKEVKRLGPYIEGSVRPIKTRRKTDCNRRDLSEDLPTQGHKRI